MLRRFLVPALLLGFLAAWLAPLHSGETEPPTATSPAGPLTEKDYELFKTLVDVMDQVERNYVKDIDRQEILEAAIDGVLRKLDPYSNYIPPERIDRFRTSIENEYGGVGILIGVDELRRLKVISPIVGSPAYRAGVQSGDLIVEIAGEPTEGFTTSDAQRLLKGPPGSEVTFKVTRRGASKPLPITVTREVVEVETVMGDARKADDSWDFMLDHEKRIGYIRITAFSRETPKDLRRALRRLTEEGLRGLVLDLRFNPGGLLDAAVAVSDLFVSDGPIVSTKNREDVLQEFKAKKAGTFEEFPMVVLVNHYSASASEIVSACLQDYRRAVVVGERTWGKGSVQNVIQLEGGGALKLTTAAYFRPSGKNIHRLPNSKDAEDWGVKPNPGYEVDVNVGRLIEHRRQKDVVRAHVAPELPLEAPDGDDPPPPFVDTQLQKALDYLEEKLSEKAG